MTDDLTAAIAEFREALPGWWMVLHGDDVSVGAQIGNEDIRRENYDWETTSGEFSAATLATALREVTRQALADQEIT